MLAIINGLFYVRDRLRDMRAYCRFEARLALGDVKDTLDELDIESYAQKVIWRRPRRAHCLGG